MERFRKLFEKIRKLDLLDLAFITFLVYVFAIPIQKRIELPTVLPDVMFSLQYFNEYGASFIYGTDVLALLIVCLVAAYYVIGKISKRQNQQKISVSWLMLTPLVFLVGLAPSLIQTHNQIPATAFYLHLILFATLALVLPSLIKRKEALMLVVSALAFSGAYQSLLAICQFALQSSLDLGILGESPFTAETLNVAKIIVDHSRVTRVYGTFPHPNVLAGFLATTIPATMSLMYIARVRILANIQKTLFVLILLIIQYTALILTFSRTGWVAAAITILPLAVYFAVQIEKRAQNRALRTRFRIFIAMLTISVATIIAASLPMIMARAEIADSNGDMAVSQREMLTQVSRETFNDHKIVGNGLHSFVNALSQHGPSSLQEWQYQPVHNIYWLVLSESGILGFTGFATLIIGALVGSLSIWRKRKTLPEDLAILGMFFSLSLISYLAIGLLDHHPYDIQQSQLVFWLGIGIIWYLYQVSDFERRLETEPASVLYKTK